MLENQCSQKWKESTETKTEADLSVLKNTVLQDAQINHSLGIGGYLLYRIIILLLTQNMGAKI